METARPESCVHSAPTLPSPRFCKEEHGSRADTDSYSMPHHRVALWFGPAEDLDRSSAASSTHLPRMPVGR